MKTWLGITAAVLVLPAGAGAQQSASNGKFAPGEQGSRNIHVLSHVPLGRLFTVGDIEGEQELSRPYVYVPRMQGTTHSTGFSIVSVKDPKAAKTIYTWTMERPE